jgi:hypothetical protein
MLILGAFALICSVAIFIGGILLTSAGLTGRGIALILLGLGIGLCALAMILAQVVALPSSIYLFYIGIFLAISSLIIFALSTLFGNSR